MFLYLYLILAALYIIHYIKSERDKILNPPVMYFVGSVIFLYPGALLRDPHKWQLNESTEWQAFFLIWISIICVGIGYSKKVISIFINHTGPNHVEKFNRNIPNTVLISIFILDIAIKVFLDQDTILGRLNGISIDTENVLGKYLSVLVTIPTAIGCLAYWFWTNSRSQNMQIRIICILMVLVGIYSLSRTPVFYVIGVNAFLFTWNRKRLWESIVRKIILIIIIVLSLPILTFIAALYKGTNGMVEGAAGGYEMEFSTAYDYANDKQSELSVSDVYGNLLFILDNYPTVYSYMPCITCVSLLTAFVPRSIFEDKPWAVAYHITNQILGAEVYERTGSSLATSTVGDLWINGGWIAVIIGSLILGLIGYCFKYLSDKHGQNSSYHYVYLMSLVMFVLIPRGDIFSTLFRGMTYLGAAIIAVKATLYFSRRMNILNAK